MDDHENFEHDMRRSVQERSREPSDGTVPPLKAPRRRLRSAATTFGAAIVLVAAVAVGVGHATSSRRGAARSAGSTIIEHRAGRQAPAWANSCLPKGPERLGPAPKFVGLTYAAAEWLAHRHGEQLIYAGGGGHCTKTTVVPFLRRPVAVVLNMAPGKPTRSHGPLLPTAGIIAAARAKRGWLPHYRAARASLSERRIRAIAQREARSAGDPHPQLIDHVESTRSKAEWLVSGGDAEGHEGKPFGEPVYLIAIRGRFVLNVSTPRGAKLPRGTVLTLMVQARTGLIVGRGLSDRLPDLAKLGHVLVDLRAHRAIPPNVQALLQEDALSTAAKHQDRSPHDIQALLTTERQARRLEDETRPGRERLSGASKPVYLVAMKGRFTFTCERSAGTHRKHGSCQRPPVLMLMVSASTKEVIPTTGWGERYPDLRSVGVPTLLAASRSCVKAPVKVGSQLAPDNGHLHVQVGQIVYVELIEPAKYATPSLPPGLPWAAPTTSNKRVLAPVELCPTSGFATLPLRLYGFLARSAGKAKLTAQLTPAWKSLPPDQRGHLHAYHSTVAVTPTKG